MKQAGDRRSTHDLAAGNSLPHRSKLDPLDPLSLVDIHRYADPLGANGNEQEILRIRRTHRRLHPQKPSDTPRLQPPGVINNPLTMNRPDRRLTFASYHQPTP